MPTGISNTMKLVFERPGEPGNLNKPAIQVYKAGPFFEVYINGFLAGKVMRKSPIITHPGSFDCEYCSNECLKLKNNVILLTEEEVESINYEIVLDAERKAKNAEKPKNYDPFA